MPNDCMKSVPEGVPGSLLVGQEWSETSAPRTCVVDKPSADADEVVQNGVSNESWLTHRLGVYESKETDMMIQKLYPR